MGAVATFDYTAWVAEFPEFTAISEPRAQGLWTRATILHSNDGSGPVQDKAVQTELLNIVTAHLAAIYVQSQNDATPGGAKDANTPVGRISSVNQGSVSAQFDMGGQATASRAYWNRTKYGVDYWYLTRRYRSFRYVSGCLPLGTLPAGWLR